MTIQLEPFPRHRPQPSGGRSPSWAARRSEIPHPAFTQNQLRFDDGRHSACKDCQSPAGDPRPLSYATLTPSRRMSGFALFALRPQGDPAEYCRWGLPRKRRRSNTFIR